MAGPSLSVRVDMVGLPVEALRLYRALRQDLGFERRDANLLVAGAFMSWTTLRVQPKSDKQAE